MQVVKHDETAQKRGDHFVERRGRSHWRGHPRVCRHSKAGSRPSAMPGRKKLKPTPLASITHSPVVRPLVMLFACFSKTKRLVGWSTPPARSRGPFSSASSSPSARHFRLLHRRSLRRYLNGPSSINVRYSLRLSLQRGDRELNDHAVQGALRRGSPSVLWSPSSRASLQRITRRQLRPSPTPVLF
jgi:hypothetical protein